MSFRTGVGWIVPGEVRNLLEGIFAICMAQKISPHAFALLPALVRRNDRMGLVIRYLSRRDGHVAAPALVLLAPRHDVVGMVTYRLVVQ